MTQGDPGSAITRTTSRPTGRAHFMARVCSPLCGYALPGARKVA